MLGELGIAVTPKQMIELFSGRSTGDCLRTIEETFTIALPAAFLADYERALSERMATELIPIDGAAELLQRLPLPCSVASNSGRPELLRKLAICRLDQYFPNAVFSASDVALAKPAPDVYLAAAQRGEVDPKDCWVVEDTPTGVSAGTAAGMTVIGYRGLFSADALLAAGATTTIDQLLQLLVLLRCD